MGTVSDTVDYRRTTIRGRLLVLEDGDGMDSRGASSESRSLNVRPLKSGMPMVAK
jgi:hypothetical protein